MRGIKGLQRGRMYEQVLNDTYDYNEAEFQVK